MWPAPQEKGKRRNEKEEKGEEANLSPDQLSPAVTGSSRHPRAEREAAAIPLDATKPREEDGRCCHRLRLASTACCCRRRSSRKGRRNATTVTPKKRRGRKGFGNDKHLSDHFSIVVVVVICLFVAAFGWSWGPLGWTVLSEIFPLETRSAGQNITVAVNLFFTFAIAVNLFFTFAIAQSFLCLICTLKFGIFRFFPGWITIMTLFVYIFLPETKGVPIEEMILLWRKHSFWKRIMPPIEVGDGGTQAPEAELIGSRA